MKSPVAGATKLSAASAPAPTATLAPPSASVAPAAPAPAAPAPAPAVSAAETRAAETVAVTGESAAASAAPAPTGTSTEDMKFGDIVRLIAEGRASEVPVPTIPDGINEAPPSVSSLAARPKPWEKAATAATEGSTETPATATDTVQ
jgi:hypothetical protein